MSTCSPVLLSLSPVAHDDCVAVFGPIGRRILKLVASPSARGIALQHTAENYNSADYHEVLYRQTGDTYIEVGVLPVPPPLPPAYGGTMKRSGFAPLDDGACLSLETDHQRVELARYEPGAPGLSETARWQICGAISLTGALLHLLPSGREAIVEAGDRDDGQADWGGGPEPIYSESRFIVDVLTGDKRKQPFETTGDSAPKVPLLAWESILRRGRERLLTDMRVIDIASGATLLQIENDQLGPSRMRVYPRFHDISADENYVLSTVPGGHCELWNVSTGSSWRPSVPPHKGVHRAILLPGGRAAFGTAMGGVIVVDCTRGLRPTDTPW